MVKQQQSILQRLFGATFVRSQNPPEERIHIWSTNQNLGTAIDTIIEENEENVQDNTTSTLYPFSPLSSPQSSRGSLTSADEPWYTGSGGSETSFIGVPLHRSHEQSNLRKFIGMQWFEYLVSLFPYNFLSRSRQSIPSMRSNESVDEKSIPERQLSLIVPKNDKRPKRKRRKHVRRRQNRPRTKKIDQNEDNNVFGATSGSSADIASDDRISYRKTKGGRVQKRSHKKRNVNRIEGPSTSTQSRDGNYSTNNSRYNLRPRSGRK